MVTGVALNSRRVVQVGMVVVSLDSSHFRVVGWMRTWSLLRSVRCVLVMTAMHL